MIHLQSSVLLFGLVLNKERKRAEVARGLAFHIFVLLSGAQGAFYQPFSLLILKQVNYDPGASSASWHLRLQPLWKKEYCPCCTARSNFRGIQIWNSFSEASGLVPRPGIVWDDKYPPSSHLSLKTCT